MKVKLRDDDRRAMDVLMDRAAIAASKSHGSTVYAAVDGRLRERVSRVEKVLGILENMPPNDPPRNLVARTLRFVENATGEHVGRNRQSAPGFYNNHQSHLA